MQVAVNLTDLWARTRSTLEDWWQIQEFRLLVWALIGAIVDIVRS